MIDFAKTLYKPEFPRQINEQISKYTNAKLPAFFEFAKDKDKSQVEKRNKSFVNKLYDKIPNLPINTRGIKLEAIDYHKLMFDDTAICRQEVSDLYDQLNKQYRYMVNMKEEHADNLQYVACKIRESFRRLGATDEQTADMLVEYLYGKKKRYKQLLWFCYGQYVVDHLEHNLPVPKTKLVQCTDCGEWFEASCACRRIRCNACHQTERKNHNRNMYQNRKIQPS